MKPYALKFSTVSISITFLVLLMLLCGCPLQPDNVSMADTAVASRGESESATLKIFCEESHLQATRMLIERYHADKGELTCVLIGFPGGTPIDHLATRSGDLVMLSAGGQGAIPVDSWNMCYAREGLVLVMNDRNPLHRTWNENGIRGRELGAFLTCGKDGEGGAMVESGSPAQPRLYMKSVDEANEKLLADFLGLDPVTFRIVTMPCNEKMMDSIFANPLAIGICCHSHAYDLVTRKQVSGISLVPLIRDSGNISDTRENFHADLDRLQRAMWLGKYPCHAFMNCYIVSEDAPAGRMQVDFMSWLLTEGRNGLLATGFIPLRTRSLDGEMQKIRSLMTAI